MVRYLNFLIALFLLGLGRAAGQPGPVAGDASDRAPATLEGQWHGSFAVPGSSCELRFTVVGLGAGQYYGTLDLPQQKRFRLPVQVRQVAGTDSVCLLVPAARSMLLARRSAEGTELRGLWRQPGGNTRVELCGQALPPALQPAGRAVMPYQEEEVRIANPLARLQLAGTLTLPAGTGPYPAVVLLSDVGEQNRDGQAAGNPTDFRLFGFLSDYLTRHGFVVLRLDDRGVGSSEGRNSNTTPVQRAGDVEAAMNYLRTRPEVDLLHLGLIGHGEGCSIAMLVAAQPLPPAFVVGLGAYGRTGYDTLLEQFEMGLQAGKLPPTEQELHLRRQSALYDLVRYSTNLAQTQSIVANMMRQNDATVSAVVAQQRTAVLLTPWSRSFLVFNPLESLAQVQCPVLLISGRADELAPPATHLDEVEHELRANGNRHVTAFRPAGVNHLLQPPAIQWTMLDGRMRPVVAPVVAQQLLQWLREQVEESR